MTGKYKYLELEPALNSAIRPLILFGNSESAGEGITKYTGPVVPFPPEGLPESNQRLAFAQKQYSVLFTYNALTIRCARLIYDNATHKVIGTGDVEVQTGPETRLGNRVECVLKGLDPKTTVE